MENIYTHFTARSLRSLARKDEKGIWADEQKALLPYGFRWIVDTITGKRQGPDRFCADITTGNLYQPQKDYLVLPENRLFFFEKHLSKATGMGLKLTL